MQGRTGPSSSVVTSNTVGGGPPWIRTPDRERGKAHKCPINLKEGIGKHLKGKARHGWRQTYFYFLLLESVFVKKEKKKSWRGQGETKLLLLLLLSRFSHVRLCATPETAAHQAPPSLGFSRQEHWSGLPFPSPMHERKSESEVAQSCLTLSDPMDCSLPGFSSMGFSRREY